MSNKTKALNFIFLLALLLFIAMLCTLKLNAEESYKGHYKVVSPKHKVSLEELEQKAKQQQGNKVISLEQLKAKEEQEALARQRELENKKLKQELANKRKQEEELAKKQAELERLNALHKQKEKERLEKLAREEELRRKLIKQRRESAIYGLYKKSSKVKVRRDEYDSEYARNTSTLPTRRKRIITNDMYIVGLLENSIDTQIDGGRAVIVIEEPVYSAEGRSLIFPKGSRVVCVYSSLEEGGDTRVPMECLRVLRPDGTSILLDNIVVADQMGKTGAVGVVDNRIYEKYGHAITMAGISGLSSYGSFALATSNNANLVALSPTLNETNDTLSDVTAQILDKTLDLAPIITVAKGTRIVLMPLNDIYITKEEYEEKEQ